MSAARAEDMTIRASWPLVPGEQPPLRMGPLEVHPSEYQVICGGRRAGLTVRELETFWALAQRADRVLSREAIYAVVWKAGMAPHDRSVDVFVGKLRSKLKRVAPEWAFVHTHFGVGYRFSPERVSPEGLAPAGGAG